MITVRLNYDTNNFDSRGSLNPYLVSQLQSGQGTPALFGNNTMKRIPLTQNQFALVDDEDFKELSKHKWYANKRHGNFYARRNAVVDGRTKTVEMHRVIMKAQKGQEIDHRNGNGLYNIKSNLRFCTCSQNHQNRKPIGGTSKYKGVSFYKPTGKWVANIRKNGILIYLGTFTKQIKAAKAYDAKALELFGEFAWINFPSQNDGAIPALLR